jgi:hypothetical protein
MAAEDWSKIAALDWFTMAGLGQLEPEHAEGGKAGKSAGVKSLISEAPG